MSADRFDRLPKWAQEEIHRLRRKVAETDAAVRALGPAGSSPHRVRDLGGDREWRIPDGAIVYFMVGASEIQCSVQSAAYAGARPMLHVSGNSTILIEPRASNLIFVRGEE